MAQLHFGAGHSVGFGTTGTGTSATASFSRSSLSNAAVGDLLVALIHSQTTLDGATITPPAGWTQFGPMPGNPNHANTRLTSLFYFPMTSQAVLNAIPDTVTWTFSTGAGRVACVVARATGIDLNAPEDVEATTFTAGTGGASSVQLAQVTTVNATALLVGAVFQQGSAATGNPALATFMTAFERYATTADGASAISSTGVALGYDDRTSAGATGTRTATWNSAVASSAGFLVAFKAGPWSPSGLSVSFTSAPDTLSTGALYYTDAADNLAIPLEVRPVPTGYASVDAMLAEATFYIGHRGGSGNWPEMSLHAYTQAAFWGVGALELSLARTSDGVWFGLHDETLDRTSGTTGFVASEHTWAEVQAHQITAAATTDPTQAARPYMRWEEVIEAYADSHVIFVDPKHQLSVASIAELLDMMDAATGPDRMVAKYYGNTTYWPAQASARGYTTWGYLYHTDAANFATYVPRWDILGLNWDADQATWDALAAAAPGKPLIGHLITSAAEAVSALGKGADGLMVSGVQDAIART